MNFYLDREALWAMGEKIECGARKLFRNGRAENENFDSAQ